MIFTLRNDLVFTHFFIEISRLYHSVSSPALGIGYECTGRNKVLTVAKADGIDEIRQFKKILLKSLALPELSQDFQLVCDLKQELEKVIPNEASNFSYNLECISSSHEACTAEVLVNSVEIRDNLNFFV